MKVKIVSDPLSSFPVSIHCPFFLSPLVSFFSYHVTSKSLNNIHSYHGMYLPKFIQNKILWSTPISQIEQCTTTLIKYQRLPGACNRSPGSKLLPITTQLHCGGHLGGRARLSDTILEEDHPMTIPSKFGSNWATGSRQDIFYLNFP
jgi:hypothetical protein